MKLQKQLAGSFLAITLLFGACSTTQKGESAYVADTVEGQYILHTVREGETMKKLARHYHMSQEEIRALNPELTKDLQKGQQVKLLNNKK